jgi:hypothetical protein
MRWLLRGAARLGLSFVLLVLTPWMRAARLLQDIHQRISGSGNRIFLICGLEAPAGAVG